MLVTDYLLKHLSRFASPSQTLSAGSLPDEDIGLIRRIWEKFHLARWVKKYERCGCVKQGEDQWGTRFCRCYYEDLCAETNICGVFQLMTNYSCSGQQYCLNIVLIILSNRIPCSESFFLDFLLFESSGMP